MLGRCWKFSSEPWGFWTEHNMETLGGGSLSASGSVAAFLVWFNWNILGLSENGEGMNHVEFASMNSWENSMEWPQLHHTDGAQNHCPRQSLTWNLKLTVSNRNPLFQGSKFQVPCLTSGVYTYYLDWMSPCVFPGKSRLIIRKSRKEEVLKDWILFHIWNDHDESSKSPRWYCWWKKSCTTWRYVPLKWGAGGCYSCYTSSLLVP